MSRSLLPSAAIGVQSRDNIVPDWCHLHALLSSGAWSDYALTDLLGLAVYHCSVHAAFGQEEDAALVRTLCGRLRQQLAGRPAAAELLALPLPDLCVLAWLNTQTEAIAEPLVYLADLDRELLGAALRQLPAASAESRAYLVQAIRYFSLRLPEAAAENCLRQLLDHYFRQCPSAKSGHYTLPLGLGGGLAGELLLLMRVYRAGIRHAEIAPRVREGVRYLLSVKREVDFLEEKYAVFPHQIHQATGEATFGAELSWCCGDLGQSLVLYHAHELLQDPELVKIAELVGLNTLLRTSARATSVSSAQLCHGAAGLASLYGKLHGTSGAEAYRKGYAFWLGQTQAHLARELAAGFYEPLAGSLSHGLVGVGLVLLSAVAEQEPAWHSILL